ncbi:MAG: phosphatidylserine decarboxylase family protein [Prolixibacteraceae bacterium]|jgi:phosphatidylserine decarboxylase|nr:phosphatidylserine decarboxylase family protein [Prolixibacteraceae bacterium]MDD4754891.1 phosphatidylserine decarboxylase family protein [Prolixibacteraceae bacterium]
MQIHREGRKIIPYAFLAITIVDILIYFTLKEYLIYYFLMAGSLFLAGLTLFFFRVPEREIEKNESNILAPADGEIVEIIKIFEKEFFNDERIQVSIFMSVFNVHQNLAPASGTVIYKNHKPGAYYPAFVKKSSEKNERCSTVFRLSDGTVIMARQIAGTVARRIVTYKKNGDAVVQGQEYGFIRFGSRVDLILPTNANINVKLHDKSVAGQTVIASLNRKK